ncbi:hypothetical protein KHO57_gp061 [Mycobacterium phage Phabba]|uniref:Uncharacterized protein n=1 Tax=Mycobacterium phage Phabba TaxID=2027899 RepID=A0A249XSF6_9CAUD|nr:hypothetical protein KHO57_gp061 [Mycobacterium phage Phabba]ASZ74636.1 hypothetical protein SEA_PHABBA_61 [Mycobacterium phage Phabba]
MKNVKITRQRITEVTLNTRMIADGELDVPAEVRRSAIDDDDYRYPWERGWSVESTEILARYQDPRNDTLPEAAQHNRMTKIQVLVTESKTVRVPEKTQEHQ